MPPHLRIQLLSEFRLFWDDQPLTTFNRQRQQALLAYLLLHRHAPQSRQQVAFTFWPDSSESQAHTNLRKLFFQLRQTLPEPDAFLVSDTLSLGWQQEAAYTFDVVALEQALDSLEKIEVPAPKTVERVVALYQGELLPTCYDDWILPIRRSLHERVVNTLTQALNGLQAQHEYEVGLRTAEHLLRLDPLHETTYRHLMHLWALSGDRARALRIYHECVTMLEQELGVSPSTETQILYQQLLQGASQVTSASSLTLVQRHEHVPLVGRKQEWQILQQAWQQMTSRGPYMATVWGEAGVGKTRLVEELLRWAKLRPGTVAYARTYEAEGALSYAPLTEWLRSEPLRRAVMNLDPIWLSELARLLPELLDAHPGLTSPTPMIEGWQRQRFHEALARAVLATPAPHLFVLDDLQWCDEEMLAWLSYLLHYDRNTPLLIVGTVRSETIHNAHMLHNLRKHLRREGQWNELEIAPLDINDAAILAGHLAEKDVTPWAAQLYQETEGNPLFIIETMRAGLLDEISVQGHPARLPDTVQAVIATRLDHLSDTARQLIQVAATIGRLFTMDVLEDVSDFTTDTLVQVLDELWHRRIIREQPSGYDFSHDKIREVIYRETSPMRRRYLHERVAHALERLYVLRLPEFAGELAAHYEAAGNLNKSITYTQQAAIVAHSRHAAKDSIRHLRHAIKLAESLPTSDANVKIRLELLTHLSFVLMESQGTASPEVLQVYEEVRALNRHMTATPDSFDLLHAMTATYRVRADYVTANALAIRLLNLAQQSQISHQLAIAYFQLGAVNFTRGEFALARRHLESGVEYCPIQEPHLRPRTWLGEVLLLLGYADLAFVHYREAIEPLRNNAAPFQVGTSLGDTIELRLVAGIHTEVAQDLELLAEIVHKHHFVQLDTLLRFLQGWSLAPAQGLPMIEHMEQGVRDFQTLGGRGRMSRYLGLIARLYFDIGEVTKAEALWAEAIRFMEQHGERFWEAELYRLKGEMLLARDNGSELEAENWLQRALTTARQQQAKLLELRAAVSLSQLWQQQSKQQDALNLLSDIYGRFTEGWDTPDLQRAKAILEALASAIIRMSS